MSNSIRVIAIITVMATMLLAAIGGCSADKSGGNDHSDITTITIAPEEEGADEGVQDMTTPSESVVAAADECHICSISFSVDDILYKV